MSQRIELRITEVDTELDQFPDPPKEPNHVVMKMIEQFVHCLSSHINADSDDNPFRMQYDSDLSTFSKQLQTSKLEVIMDKAQELKNQEAVAKEARSKKKTPTQKRKRSGEAISRKRVKSSPFASSSGKAIGLDALQMRYDRGATNSIPGSINDKVTEQLIRESCAEWKDIVGALLKSFSGLVRGMISDSIEEALSQWNRTKLYGAMQHTTLAYFNQMMATEGHDINKHLDRMYAYPTTYNKDFEVTRRSFLKSLMEQRYPMESARHARATSTLANASLTPLKTLYKEAKDADSQWTNERLVEDKFGSMINCVATIHTFQDILSSSLADTISMHLKSDILAKLRDETAAMLRAELKVLDTPHCAQLLAEDPAREKQRKKLLAEKAKLEKAVAIIEDLQDTE
jgi:hypothetical protein